MARVPLARPDGIDLSDPDHFSSGAPHHWFTWMRAEDPVYWQPETDGPGFWNLTRYEDVRSVSREPLTFSSWRGGTNIFDLSESDLQSVRTMMLNMDPPQHTKFRRIVSKGFTPKRIGALHEQVKVMASQIVDAIAEKGECEFVDEVASQLPMATICEFLGVPESDRRLIYDLSNKLIGFDDPDFQTSMDDGAQAAAEMYMYAESLGAERSKCPMDDLTTVLLHAEVDGEKLTQTEFDSFFLMLALAGNETTRTVTAQGMRLLSEHPDQHRRVVEDMSLLPSAIEEMLRYNPAVLSFRRTATRELNLRGKRIREGDKIVMWYPSANRDEDVFVDPQRFDIGRSPNDHLAFGTGEHYCLGASLARLQLHAIFHELLTRLPDIHVSSDVKFLRSNFIDGIKEMHVRFTPQARREQA